MRRLDVTIDAMPPAGCVVRSLRRLADAKSRCGRTHPEVRLVTVLMRSNIEQLSELVRLARRQLEAETPGEADAARVEASFDAARALAEELGIALEQPRGQALLRVWWGDAYRAFRERLASGEPPEMCRGCALYRCEDAAA